MIGATASVMFKDHLPEFSRGGIGYYSPIMAKAASQSDIKGAQQCLLPIAYHSILICVRKQFLRKQLVYDVLHLRLSFVHWFLSISAR
jgi:hypothetical protein